MAGPGVSLKSGPKPSVALSHVNPYGDRGYPGTLSLTTTYTLDNDGALTIAFDAKTDKPTVVNMTNHAIFNLAGDGAPQGATQHRRTVPAAYTPVNAKLLFMRGAGPIGYPGAAEVVNMRPPISSPKA